MMKYLFVIVINILIVTSLFSQSTDYFQDKDTSLLFQKKQYLPVSKYDQKMQFHIATGASVTSFGNHTMFSKWIAPGLSYQLNSKLNMYFGSLVLNENNNLSFFSSEFRNAERSDPTRAFIYISGDYQLNKSVRFRATTFNEIQGRNSNQNNYYYNQMGIDIKISDNFFISADFINQRGNQPFGMQNRSLFFDSGDYQGNGFFSNVLRNTFH